MNRTHGGPSLIEIWPLVSRSVTLVAKPRSMLVDGVRDDARFGRLPLPIVDDHVRIIRLITRVPDDELEGDRLARLDGGRRRQPARGAAAAVVLPAVRARIVEAGTLELAVAERTLVARRCAEAPDLCVCG